MTRTLLAIATLLVTSPLYAQDARPTVEVVAAGPSAVLSALSERIRALEARFAVSVRWTAVSAIDVREVVAPRAADDGVFARVWLDLGAPERAVLFIANAGHDRLLVRVVPSADDYGELTRESLATVVESAIDALLAGGQIGVERGAALHELETQTGTRVAPIATAPTAEAAPAVPAREPAVVAPRGRTPARPLLLALQYRGDAVDGGPALRHGVQLAASYALDARAELSPLLLLSVEYAPPFSLVADGRDLSQHGGGARVGAGLTTRTTRRLAWQAALEAGADLARIEPVIAERTGLTAAEPFTRVEPVAGALTALSLRPAAWLELALGVGVDLPLVAPHYDVRLDGKNSAVLTPWRLRPYAFFGIGLPLTVGAQ